MEAEGKDWLCWGNWGNWGSELCTEQFHPNWGNWGGELCTQQFYPNWGNWGGELCTQQLHLKKHTPTFPAANTQNRMHAPNKLICMRPSARTSTVAGTAPGSMSPEATLAGTKPSRIRALHQLKFRGLCQKGKHQNYMATHKQAFGVWGGVCMQNCPSAFHTACFAWARH